MMIYQKLKLFSLLLVASCLPIANCVDHGNFKTCQQSSFCRRHRAIQEGASPYRVLLNSLVQSDKSLSIDIVHAQSKVVLTLTLFPMKDSTLRVKITEKEPLYERFEEPYSVLPELSSSRYTITPTAEAMTISFETLDVVVKTNPFVIDVYQNKQPVVSINSRGLLKFEHYRTKPSTNNENVENENNDENKVPEVADTEENSDGMWEETFKGHVDSKPRGPASIGVDITFIDSHHVYGIPEHADSFSLKETASTDPYRLYNLDVFEYELDTPMALYGSIPVLVSHSVKQTSGVFWHNAAETWIDIKKLPPTGVVSSLTGLFSETENPAVISHWMSESGIIDVFVMGGSGPADVFRQYAHLTGTTPLPPMFSLGYHQSRWNYNSQQDVAQVHQNFDEHNLPMDVLWLDIEHSDGKRYFTWDKHKFSDPLDMTANLTIKGRKLVTIVDPHIKRDTNYFFYKELQDADFFVKTKDGNEYDGWCWPGSSSYIDFTNPEAREHYANTYRLDRYKGSTLDTFTWNDMNEPSVFNGPEITMQKDNIHPGLGVEHRELHNVYGLLFHASTYQGHLKRSNSQLRPFVLTRSFYAGSQRTAAVWTGDNLADWGHLRIAVPMILSMGVTGVTHTGADIGGFFGNPDQHLLARWYQAASYTAFFRAHAHIDTKRREPWLFDQETLNIIREAIRDHYRLLPYWYTLFYENEISGMPPLRPLWVEFPQDQSCFGIDNEYMVGPGLLVRPVVEEGATTANVYFPQGRWYDVKDLNLITGPASLTVEAPRNKIPVYQRGGTIIPEKRRPRRSSSLMRNDPITLVAALDADGKAKGTLYIDDERSFEYRQNKYLYLDLAVEGGLVTSKVRPPGGSGFKTGAWLERIVIYGVSSGPSKIVMHSSAGTVTLDFSFEGGSKVVASKLVIRKPGINIAEEYTITIH